MNSLSPRLKKFLARLAAVWRWLTEPSAAVQEPDQRRQAQLLAGLLVSVVPLGLLLTIIPILLEHPGAPVYLDPEFQVTASAFIFSGIAYGLSRTRHYKIAAVFVLVTGSAAIFAAAIPDNQVVSMNLLIYLILPIALASDLLSLRAATILTVANLAGMVVFTFFFPQITLLDILSDAFSFVLLASIIVLLIAHHRNLLEADRRALLAQKEARLRQVTDNMQDLICQVDSRGKIEYASPSFSKVLGYLPENLVGQSVFSLIHPDDLPAAKNLFREEVVTQTTRRLQHRVQHADGHFIWLEAVGSILLNSQGMPTGAIIASRDITERKLAEEALLAQEARYRTLMEQAADAIFIADERANYVDVNTAACTMLGYTRDELLGLNITDVVSPEDLTSVPIPWEQMRAGTIVMERHLLRKDGMRVEVEVSAKVLEDGRLVVMARDVTERKLMERRQFELAVEKERADILQQFLGDASHDLRTPLTIIKTSIYLLRRFIPLDKRERHLDILEEQANHLQKLLDDFLSMSRLNRAEASEFNFAPLDVCRVVQDVLLSYTTLAAQKHHHIEYAQSAGILPLLADETNLKRAFSHLIANALNYTPDGGAITVKIAQQEDWVIVQMRDTGVGINALDLPRVFEPFFRADKARSSDTGGTGLGLAIVQRIVTAHGGRVEVESSPGSGSVFSVWLTLMPEMAASSE